MEDEEPRSSKLEILYTNLGYTRDDLVKLHIPSWIVRRGDVIHFGRHYDRNDGKMVWDGKKLIDLDDESDDGSCPEDILIDEFPSTQYFVGAIANNSVVCIDLSRYKVLQEKKLPEHRFVPEMKAYELQHQITSTILYVITARCPSLPLDQKMWDHFDLDCWGAQIKIHSVFPLVSNHNAITNI